MCGSFCGPPSMRLSAVACRFLLSSSVQDAMGHDGALSKRVADEPSSERTLDSYMGARSRAAVTEVAGDFAGEARYHGVAQSRLSKFTRRRPWKTHLSWSSDAPAIASSH